MKRLRELKAKIDITDREKRKSLVCQKCGKDFKSIRNSAELCPKCKMERNRQNSRDKYKEILKKKQKKIGKLIKVPLVTRGNGCIKTIYINEEEFKKINGCSYIQPEKS